MHKRQASSIGPEMAQMDLMRSLEGGASLRSPEAAFERVRHMHEMRHQYEMHQQPFWSAKDGADMLNMRGSAAAPKFQRRLGLQSPGSHDWAKLQQLMQADEDQRHKRLLDLQPGNLLPPILPTSGASPAAKSKTTTNA